VADIGRQFHYQRVPVRGYPLPLYRRQPVSGCDPQPTGNDRNREASTAHFLKCGGDWRH
jgi:hypothetical protein